MGGGTTEKYSAAASFLFFYKSIMQAYCAIRCFEREVTIVPFEAKRNGKRSLRANVCMTVGILQCLVYVQKQTGKNVDQFWGKEG